MYAERLLWGRVKLAVFATTAVSAAVHLRRCLIRFLHRRPFVDRGELKSHGSRKIKMVSL